MNPPEPTPLVSICIPAFNAARWLPSTLESVLAQTYPNLEIIVIDDGSTDDTPSIAQGFAARGVRAVSQRNAGAAAARNHALRLAHGDYIKFLDADDLISPEMIERQVTVLADRPDYIAQSEWARFVIDPGEALFVPYPGWHDSDDPLTWLCETWEDTQPMYQCGMFLIPRSVLERVGGWDERLSLIDDFEFFTRIILESKGIVHTPEARLYYRSRLPGSLSAQGSRQAWESAHLSTMLSVHRVLAREDTAKTRRLAANMLQKLIYSFYPKHADLQRSIEEHIHHLGGSDLAPDGGPWFRTLASFVGWRFAARIRYQLGRRPR